MSKIISISKENSVLAGRIKLDGSKSISNRALLIEAIIGTDLDLQNIGSSDDIVRMRRILSSDDTIKDAGPAGTTFRFSTAYYAFQPGTQILTGSQRMKQRPIGPLVDALRKLGAKIAYQENEGFPPLVINAPATARTNDLSIPADTSSQFISALLMLGPTLPDGLNLTLEGDVVSRSYIEMTLSIMRSFGAKVSWKENTIHVEPQNYKPTDYYVESDWSAASYYYALAAFADECELYLDGLTNQGIQGDSALIQIFTQLGVETVFTDTGVKLIKTKNTPKTLEWDFILCPDIAQTLAVTCAGLGVTGLFTGLKTLSIKETDRIEALKTELAKVAVGFSKLPQKFSKKKNEDYYLIDGKAMIGDPLFNTYHDHRMAMAFAPLGMLSPIRIEDPDVVIKSYPDFWKDLESLGFKIVDVA